MANFNIRGSLKKGGEAYSHMIYVLKYIKRYVHQNNLG